MRTDPKEDPVAATRRRLEEFGRLWASGGDAVDARPDESGRLESGRADPPVRGHRGYGASTALRLNPRHLGLLALAAMVFVLVAIWWTARAAPSPMPVADTTPAAASLSSSPTPATSAPVPSSTPSAAVVVVDVAGKVRRPLVVTLPVGSRVVDAIRKAGGPRPGVDLSGLNLARVLVDGEQVLVGRRMPGAQPARAAGTGAPATGTGAGTTGARTDLNRASAAELENLPGVGPVTARKIIEWRTANGPFTAAEDLLEVDGIGPKTLAEIRPAVTW